MRPGRVHRRGLAEYIDEAWPSHRRGQDEARLVEARRGQTGRGQTRPDWPRQTEARLAEVDRGQALYTSASVYLGLGILLIGNIYWTYDSSTTRLVNMTPYVNPGGTPWLMFWTFNKTSLRRVRVIYIELTY